MTLSFVILFSVLFLLFYFLFLFLFLFLFSKMLYLLHYVPFCCVLLYVDFDYDHPRDPCSASQSVCVRCTYN